MDSRRNAELGWVPASASAATRLALIGLVIAITAAAYWPATQALWVYWTLPYMDGQGLLIAGITLWLLFRQRRFVATADISPSWWGGIPLTAAGLAYVIVWRAGIQSLQIMLLPALILLATLVGFGVAVARRVAVPIGYLYFSMPAWGILGIPLRDLTVKVAGAVSPLLGLPATVHDSWVSFPNGVELEVTVDCSGLSFLVQALAVATLLGELEDASVGHRLRLLAGAFLLALVANWVRVLILLDVAYETRMRHVLISRDHLWFGTALFALVLLLFVWVATRGALPGRSESSRNLRLVRVARRVTEQLPAARTTFGRAYVAACMLLSAPPLLAYALTRGEHSAGVAHQLQPPLGRNGWRGPVKAEDANWQPLFVGAHGEYRATYADSKERTVDTLAIVYPSPIYSTDLLKVSRTSSR